VVWFEVWPANALLSEGINILEKSNQQSAITNRRFADILLQHPYRFAASVKDR
jgi:hypothetical protein